MAECKVGVAGVIRDRNRILLGQRLKKDEAFGQWVFPGGGLEIDESFEEAVMRECGEEVGLQIEVGDLITATRSAHSGKLNVCLLFWAYPKFGQVPTPSEEIGNPQFFTLEDTEYLNLMPVTRDVLRLIEGDLK